MKLYMHPVSMTSRPVSLFVAQNKMDVTPIVVDLMTGEHLQPAFLALNPNALVPVLEDGDLVLTESSAILKYLADTIDSPTYPRDLKARAKVNERMDWFNTNFYRDFGYGLVYPQVFPHHRRPTEDLQAGTLAWGKERAAKWLRVLDEHWLGPDADWVAGDQITIADYFGSGLVTLGEVVRCDFKQYPNVSRWLDNIKKLSAWGKVNEAFYGFVAHVKDQPFVAL